MTSMFTLLSFAAKLGAIEADLKLAGQGIIAEYALKVRQNAMDAIGTYHYGWSPLGPEAVARHGDTPFSTPASWAIQADTPMISTER
jgi:hypothetical protein